MKIRFQCDYNLKRAIITGVKRRQPEINFQNADYYLIPQLKMLLS